MRNAQPRQRIQHYIRSIDTDCDRGRSSDTEAFGTWTVALNPSENPVWVEITLQRERHRLPVKHQEFIDAMARNWKRPFTAEQEEYLQDLFDELEGRATTNWPWE
jgi:hypothetical protein